MDYVFGFGLGQVLSGLDNQIEKGAVCYISRTALSDEGYIVLVSFDEELAYVLSGWSGVSQVQVHKAVLIVIKDQF